MCFTHGQILHLQHGNDNAQIRVQRHLAQAQDGLALLRDRVATGKVVIDCLG